MGERAAVPLEAGPVSANVRAASSITSGFGKPESLSGPHGLASLN